MSRSAPDSRGSPSPSPTETFSVHESVWTREQDGKGRVYFFNRATGVSQWHIPNDLYKAKVFDPVPCFEDVEKMPGSARAVLGVDCVTEVPQQRGSTAAESIRRQVFSRLDQGPRVREAEDKEPILAPEPVLKVTIVTARGLRDTDFMPGKDKSDPYCTCEVMGKPGCLFRTPVVSDCLEPQWNYWEYVPGYVEGDVLVITVWDRDAELQDVNANRLRSAGNFDVGDDMLGKMMLTEEDLTRPKRKEYRLEGAGKGMLAFLTVETAILTAWPQMVGMNKVDAVFEIERAAPSFKVQALEQPDSGSSVVSWDIVHRQQGYSSNFFGAFEDDAGKLKRGDSIEVGGVHHTFDKLGGPRTEQQKSEGRTIRYLYFQEDFEAEVRDGTRWRKVTPEPAPGFHADRIIVYFDASTGKVSKMPHVG